MQPLILLPILLTWNIQSPIGTPNKRLYQISMSRCSCIVVVFGTFFFSAVSWDATPNKVVANDK